MSSDEGLVGHVPYLRRFARALTGSQTLGRCMRGRSDRTLLAGKAGSIPARIALYRSVLAEVDALEARPASPVHLRQAVWIPCSATSRR